MGASETRPCPESPMFGEHSQFRDEGSDDWYCPTCIDVESGECPNCSDTLGEDTTNPEQPWCHGCDWPRVWRDTEGYLVTITDGNGDMILSLSVDELSEHQVAEITAAATEQDRRDVTTDA